jgi:N-acetyl-anhydromuramyl-L-alanine amidase AmpD
MSLNTDINIIESQFSFKTKLQKRLITQMLVLHHADASNCSVIDIHKWHLENGWAGIGYHFFVKKNGEIYRGRPIDTIGAHVSGYNGNTIGICAEGAYNKETMPDAQTYSIIELVKYIQNIYNNKLKIVQHKDLNNDTDCAGKNYPFDVIIKLTQSHWAEEHYNNLVSKGIKISDKRFDDKITRGEVFALLSQIMMEVRK